ncbi:MAG TPA: diaminopimelate epimerase [Candidatus Polarisedimenticolaceae bacterium]|nr:diaminopimelate epimerase [Candidatus Polarisedimenticolaceae bacterium]
MSHGVPFAKMSGAGNDFVVLDASTWGSITDRVSWVRRVCRRGLSVGSDGVLVVGPEDGGVRVVFFNPDGGEAFCGNGSRCAARFAAARGMAPRSMTLATYAGAVAAEVDGDRVRLVLPPPVDQGEIVLRDAEGSAHRARLIVAGVPHVVLRVEGLDRWPLARIAPALRRDPSLGPAGANIDAVETESGGAVRVRTWERGVEGETLACGSGAVASALLARIQGAGERVTVVPRSGIPLVVELPGDPRRPSSAILIGDARFVFEGALSEEGLGPPP